jgi:hypothetical protein
MNATDGINAGLSGLGRRREIVANPSVGREPSDRRQTGGLGLGLMLQAQTAG